MAGETTDLEEPTAGDGPGESLPSPRKTWPEKIAAKLKVLPEAPGVYKMLDDRGHIIYVGKAKILRNRVRSYFHSHVEREITRLLVSRIADFDWIVVGSEKEALILENNLIKEHQPHFNISLMDNKTYPYIKITTDEPWPRAIKTRELTKRGQFYGPYTDLPLMYTFLDVLREVYPLKKCEQRHFPKGFKPCLYYHIGRCLPYCTGEVTDETKQNLLKEIGEFLRGHTETAIGILRRRMEAESARQEFERAMAIRDQIQSLERIKERQQVVLTSRNAFEVVYPYISEGVILFSVLSFREGKLLDKHLYPFENGLLDGLSDSTEQDALVREELEHFLTQYFGEHPFPVEEILLPFPPERLPSTPTALEDHLEGVIRHRFRGDLPDGWKGPKLSQPLRGDKVRLLELAESNARLSFFELQREKEKNGGASQLKMVLGLKKIPRRVESFDIANTAERAIIAGMVHFADGKPDKQHYRVFNIRSVTGPDDFASMREAVTRRYRRLLDEKAPLPDLILIDGGKGQLSAATEALRSLGLADQPVVSLAKQEEELFVPGREESIRLPHDDPALRFVVMIRDETHRWVNGRHTQRRDKEALTSRLLAVPGIGEAKIKSLYEHFDSVEDFLKATDEEQGKVPLLSGNDRAAIRKAFTKPATRKYRLKDPATWEKGEPGS